MNKQVIAASVLVLSLAAGAQSLKPGLWEVTNKTQMGGQGGDAMAQMQKEMASMPPEQRKMMQEMMSKHGASMGSGGGMTIKMCMTKDMVERNQVAQTRDDCKTTMQPRAGNTVKMSFTCSNPPSSGEGQITYASPEAYSMKMTVNSKVDGKVHNAVVDTSGKWLGADCGSTKPPTVK